MNKFLFIPLTLLIVSCDVDNSEEDKRYSEKQIQTGVTLVHVKALKIQNSSILLLIT